ncbi:MAG TPA: DUF4398 domain-containing protein [Steroidobacteraceae bacterium]
MTPRAALIPAAFLGALAAACATQPQPTEELTRARAVIQQADKTNAQRYAAADLQRAHDELNNAEKSSAEKKYDEARRYAESAEADADVATARASAGEAERAAHEVNQGNETLRDESERRAAGNASGVTPAPATPPPPEAVSPTSPNSGPN